MPEVFLQISKQIQRTGQPHMICKMSRARTKTQISQCSQLYYTNLSPRETNEQADTNALGWWGGGVSKRKKYLRKNFKTNKILIKGKVEYGLSVTWNIFMMLLTEFVCIY